MSGNISQPAAHRKLEQLRLAGNEDQMDTDLQGVRDKQNLPVIDAATGALCA
jgi:hypothetical protein